MSLLLIPVCPDRFLFIEGIIHHALFPAEIHTVPVCSISNRIDAGCTVRFDIPRVHNGLLVFFTFVGFQFEDGAAGGDLQVVEFVQFFFGEEDDGALPTALIISWLQTKIAGIFFCRKYPLIA